MSVSIATRNNGWENNTWVKYSCVFILPIVVWSWTCRFSGFPSVWLGVISSPWRWMKAYFSEMVSKPRQASSVSWKLLLVLVLLCAALLWSTLYTSLSLTLLSKWIWLCKASLLYLYKKRFSAIHIFLEIASYLAGADNKRYCHCFLLLQTSVRVYLFCPSDRSLLGFHTMWCCRFMPVFWMYILAPSSGWRKWVQVFA